MKRFFETNTFLKSEKCIYESKKCVNDEIDDKKNDDDCEMIDDEM